MVDLQKKIRRTNNKKSAKFDYQHALHEMAYNKASLKRPERLLKMITRFIDREFSVTHTALLFLDKKKDGFTFVDSQGRKKIPLKLIRFDRNHVLVKWFEQKAKRIKAKDYLYRADLKSNAKKSNDSDRADLRSQMAKVMDDFKVELVIPGYYKKELLGMLFLGAKKSRRCFTDSEIAFFQILVQDCAMAFKNAEFQNDLLEQNEALEKQLKEIIKLRDKESKTFHEILRSLAQEVYAKDAYTFGHVKQVERLGLMTAKEMKYDLSGNRKSILSASLILHDLGKIGIPDNILNKPARLDSDEWKIMQTHVDKGAKILEHLSDFKKVAKVVWCHHENFDGGGYPNGIKGEAIPIESRIVSAVDAFHAIVSTRCYSKGQPIEYAFCELRRCAGTQFDPQVVEALISAVKREMKKRGRKLAVEYSDKSEEELSAGLLS